MHEPCEQYLQPEHFRQVKAALSTVEIDCNLPTPPLDVSDCPQILTLRDRLVQDLVSVLKNDNNEDDEARRLRTLKSAIRLVISLVGDDPEREGLLKTPERYAKALSSFTAGYQLDINDVINGAIFHEDNDSDTVIVKDIEVFSLCEHHLVPFYGKIHIGYIPNGRVLGLSKFARIVEVFARRLQIQERLTRQVALAVEELLEPKGVAVAMESTHLCMVMRGVEKTSSSTTTTTMLGCFKNESDLRHEFLSSIRGKQ